MPYPDEQETVVQEANEEAGDPSSGTLVDADHWNVLVRLVNALQAYVGSADATVGDISSHEGRLKLIEASGAAWSVGTYTLAASDPGTLLLELSDTGFYCTLTGSGSGGSNVHAVTSTIVPRFFAADIGGLTLQESALLEVGEALLQGETTWEAPLGTVALMWIGADLITHVVGAYGAGGAVGAGGSVIVQDEGTPLTARGKLNFRGLGVSATDDSANNRTNIDISSGTGGHAIEDEGTGLPGRTKLNFVGDGVAATDDSADDASLITIPGVRVQSGGSDVTPQRNKINFIGPGVTVVDTPGSTRTDVTIPGPAVQSSGAPLTNRPKLNFSGNVSVTDDSGNDRTNIVIGSGGSGGLTVQEDGTPLTQRGVLDFVGPGITAEDDPTNGKTTVEVPYFTTSIPGVVPPSTGAGTDYLSANGTWTAPGGGGGAGTVDVEDEGVAEGAADTIDFVGAGVSVGFAAGKATITIPGGGGASGLGVYDPYGNAVTPPTAASLTVLNGGSVGVDSDKSDTPIGLLLWNKCSTAGASRAWVVGNIPVATAYSWTALLKVDTRAWDQAYAGICLFEAGADPKVAMIGFWHGQTLAPKLIASKFNVLSGGSTGHDGDYFSEQYMDHTIWVRIGDNLTNRRLEWSGDGENWHAYSVGYGSNIGSTNWITPDRYGFFMWGNNGGDYQFMHVLSAELTTP